MVGAAQLAKSQDRWPKSKVRVRVRVRVIYSISNVINSERNGTAERLFGVTSWVLRFVFNIQTRRKSVERRNGELSVDELNEADGSQRLRQG